MKTLVFEVEGEYGHFKKPYSPMSPVSYPVPPPPAVLGLVGAIMGFSKEDYHQRLGWDRIMIGIRLLKPVRKFYTALNLLNTKYGTDRFFRPTAGGNTHTQVPYEFLKQPAFRIYVAGLSGENHSRLRALLEEGRTVYNPVLGLAQCLADIRWIGEEEALGCRENEISLNSVVVLDREITPAYDAGRRYHRTRMPARMDGSRVVHRYQDVLFAEDAGPVICRLAPGAEVYRVGLDNVSFFAN